MLLLASTNKIRNYSSIIFRCCNKKICDPLLNINRLSYFWLLHQAKEKGLRGPLLGQPYPVEFLQDLDNLLRPPLAGIAKKANRQIKATREYLQIPDAVECLSASMTVSGKFRRYK